MKLYPRPATVSWLLLTMVGITMSALSLREGYRGIEAVRRVALRRQHANDILSMANRNMVSEKGRLLAQSLFGLAGVLALLSKPRRYLSPASPVDRVLPWILVAVEGILVGNSVNEYLSSQQVLRRRATNNSKEST